MADAYKGLTIRIGGDATGLQKALRSADSAISTTQKQLRKMVQALKMDPGNTQAIAKNLELVGQKAVEVSGRLNTLKSSLKQISGQKVELFGGKNSLKTIQQLASETRDAAERAAQAKEAYANLTNELASLYAPITKAVRGVKDFEAEWEKLHNGDKFTMRDLVDEEGFDGAIATIRELGVVTDDEIDTLRRVRTAWEQAFDENEIAKAVNGFADLHVEIDRSEAEVRSLAQQFSQLTRQSFTASFGEGIDDQLRRIDSAAELCADSLQRASKALDMDPTNVTAAEQKLRALSESSQLAQQKMALLQEKLSRMDDAKIGAIADGTKDVQLQATKAAEEYDELTAAIIECEGKLSSLRDQQNKLASSDKLDSEEYRRLQGVIEATTLELNDLRQAQERAKDSFETASQVQEYQQLKTQIAETHAQLSKLNNDMRAASSGVDITSGSFMSLGLSLSTSVTPALMGMGSYAIQSARDIDSAYRDMRKTVQATEEQFEDLRQSAVDFSTTHVTSADQILSIQAIGGELGVATDDLKTFAETVSNLNVASNLSVDEAATSLGQLDNILDDLNGDTMPNFADALVRLGNNGASTESQITDIASRIGSMASIIGMSTPEILAWSSTIASTGQGAEAAGTAISKTMSDIENAVANGGDNLQAFAEVAGMSAEEFASAWESSPSDALHAFIDGLNGIEENGGSAVATLTDLGITAVRQKQGIQGLMQMIDGLDNNLQMSENAWNGVSDAWGQAGDAANEAQAKSEGFSGSLSRLENIAQVLSAEFGESLAPVMDFLADAMKGVYDVVSDLPDGFKQAVVGLGGLTAAAGPAILLFRSLAEFTGDMKKASSQLKAMAIAAENVGDATKGAVGGIGSLKSGLIRLGATIAVVGIGALIAHLMEMQQEAEETERATRGLEEACRVADASMASFGESSNIEQTLTNIKDANDDTRSSLAALADEFDQINISSAASISQLSDAKTAISELNGQSNLTAEQVGRLKSAVELLNNTCGENYSVVRDESGAYTVMKDGAAAAVDEINNLIDAQIKQVQISAQVKKLESLYEEQAGAVEKYREAVEAVTEAQQRYAEARQKYGEQGAEALEGRRLEEANSELEEATGNLDNVNGRIADVNESIGNLEGSAQGAYEAFDELVMGSSSLNNLFDGDTDVMSDFSDALEQSGISLENFRNMSETDLIKIAEAWRTSGGDVSSICKQLGIDINGMSGEIKNAITSLNDGEMSTALQNAGISVDQLSIAMSNAGMTASSLSGIASADFANMAANCGGSIDNLIWMIQNYNNVPIIDKNGNITADTTQLIDAQGQVFTWNGTQLVDKSGNAVIYWSDLSDAQREKITWNETGIATLDGKAVVDDTSLTDAQGHKVEWNGTNLENKDATADVETSGLQSAIDLLRTWNSTPANNKSATFTTTRKTINITENQTVGKSSGVQRFSLPVGGAVGAQVPMASSFSARSIPDTQSAASIASVAAARAVTASGDSGAKAAVRAIRSVVPDRKSTIPVTKANGGTIGTYIEDVNINQKVITPDEDIYVAAPVAARNAAREIRRLGR